MIELDVHDMSCAHCVDAVTRAVKSADPDAEVEVDLSTHKVRIETTQNREVMVAALADAGYPAN